MGSYPRKIKWQWHASLLSSEKILIFDGKTQLPLWIAVLWGGFNLSFAFRKSHSNRMHSQKRINWSLWPKPRPYQKRNIIPQADGRLLVYFSLRPWNKKIVRFLSEAKRFLAREYMAWEKECCTPPRCIKGQFQTVIFFLWRICYALIL